MLQRGMQGASRYSSAILRPSSIRRPHPMHCCRARVYKAEWIRRNDQLAYYPHRGQPNDYIRSYSSAVQKRCGRSAIHVWDSYFSVAPEAKAVIASGWVDLTSSNTDARSVEEGYDAMMKIASIGCVAAAYKSIRRSNMLRVVHTSPLSCIGRVKRGPEGKRPPSKHRKNIFERTAVFCLQDYCLVLSVLLPDGKHTTLYFDFGFAMTHLRVVPRASTVLSILTDVPSDHIERPHEGVLTYLVKYKIIRKLDPFLMVQVCSGERVLSIHDTRPILNEHRSPIHRMVFNTKKDMEMKIVGGFHRLKRRGVKRQRCSEIWTP